MGAHSQAHNNYTNTQTQKYKTINRIRRAWKRQSIAQCDLSFYEIVKCLIDPTKSRKETKRKPYSFMKMYLTAQTMPARPRIVFSGHFVCSCR